MTPHAFVVGDLVWYNTTWRGDRRRTLHIPGTVTAAGIYWCFVTLLLRDGRTRRQRVGASSLTRRDPEEPYT